MSTIIQLLRHGTPDGGNKFRGHRIDDPLSEQGWQQMWSAVGHNNQWDTIISSPLERCQAFATAYAKKFQLDLIIDERLKEIGFGHWEGLSSQEILDNDPQAIKNFYHDPIHHQPEGAEPLRSFQTRVRSALEHFLKEYRNQKILIVAHAGVIRAAITHITQSPESSMYRISIANAALVTIIDDGNRPPTLSLN